MDKTIYISKLHKEFLNLKQVGCYSSCRGILACPECDTDLKDSSIIGWGMVSSFYKNDPEPAMLYECKKCFTKSYAHMSSGLMYYRLRDRFGVK